MNGYNLDQGMQPSYGPRCPYRDTCPARTQCPYCPHQMESVNGMNPGNYSNMNMNMQMEYYVKDNANPVLYPYENMAPVEAGYENFYPEAYNMMGNTNAEPYGNEPSMAQYNQYGYINPDENNYSPWANNAVYGNMVNPLPMKNCPFQ